MLSKTVRAVALASTLAAVGAVSPAITPASAFTADLPFTNLAVSGTLTPKKLNQPVTLPEGSAFNGELALELPAWSGPITGSVFVPPFNTTITILGVPTVVGVTFTQVGTTEGSLSRDPTEDCPGATEPNEICLTMSVPTKANVGITEVSTTAAGILGVSTTTQCETSEPLTLSLSTTLTIAELVDAGPHFSGTTTIPPIRCYGLSGVALGPVLTTLMSGPDNPYQLAIAPPSLG